MEKNQNKLIEDLITRQVLSLNFDASVRTKMLKNFKRLQDRVVRRIQDSGLGDTEFTRARVNVLYRIVSEVIDKEYGIIYNQTKRQLVDYGFEESKQVKKYLSNTVVVATAGLNKDQVKNIFSKVLIEGAFIKEWWERQAGQVKRAFLDNMREGLLLGEDNRKLIQRVRGTASTNFRNGIMSIAFRNAEAIVRTSVQGVANASRFSVFEANNDIIEFYEHTSTLDSRTSDVCIARDGLRWDAKTKEPVGHNLPFQSPPLHWNCRSILVGIVKGLTISDNAVRSSQDGAVKGSFTFDDFLKSKSETFQDNVLGKGKAELYRSGKITLRQLLDQSGNPLSLSQIKTYYNL